MQEGDEKKRKEKKERQRERKKNKKREKELYRSPKKTIVVQTLGL